MNSLTLALPFECEAGDHYQPSPTATAVSQACITEKRDQELQVMYFQEDIEPLPIEKKTDLQLKRKPPLKYRSCCVKRCYCICLPKWARYAIWSSIVAFLLVIIVLGSIFATFNMPTFDLIGLSDNPGGSTPGSSSLTVANGKFSYHFSLKVNVNNPNIFPLHFSKMNATAYYSWGTEPYLKTPIGGGYLFSQWVPAKSIVTFKYPFHFDYDPSLDADQGVLSSLTDKCGLTGNQPQDLSIDYSIRLTASALFITIHPVISSSALFPCPIDV